MLEMEELLQPFEILANIAEGSLKKARKRMRSRESQYSDGVEVKVVGE